MEAPTTKPVTALAKPVLYNFDAKYMAGYLHCAAMCKVLADGARDGSGYLFLQNQALFRARFFMTRWLVGFANAYGPYLD